MDLPLRVREVVDRLEETRGLYYNLARPSASLLFVLARLLRPKEIVEVGTSNGYSALILGAAVKPFGGRVTTIERSGRLVEEARRNIMDAGLQDVVTVYPGSAYKILPRLPGPIRFVFLDATKQEYSGYLERIQPQLAPHALIAADNILSHPDELRDFTRTMLTNASFTTSVVPIGTGLLLGVYEPAPVRAEDRPVQSMNELVASAAPRIFRGTVSEVRSGSIFEPSFTSQDNASQKMADRTFDGYDRSLAEESERLPTEE